MLNKKPRQILFGQDKTNIKIQSSLPRHKYSRQDQEDTSRQKSSFGKTRHTCMQRIHRLNQVALGLTSN